MADSRGRFNFNVGSLREKGKNFMNCLPKFVDAVNFNPMGRDLFYNAYPTGDPDWAMIEKMSL